MPKEAPVLTLARYNWAMVAIVLLAAAVRLPSLGGQSLWYDEAMAVAVGSAPWPVLLQARLVDGNHPPLFFMFMKVALFMWGITEFGVRFLAAGAGLLAIPLIYRLGRAMFNRPAALLAALLLALNPIHVWLSQEARMYSLLILVVTGSMFFFWQALQTNKLHYWAGLLIMNGLAFNLEAV